MILVILSAIKCFYFKYSPHSVPRWQTGDPSMKRIKTPQNTNTEKHTREHERVNESEKNGRVRQSDTLTLPLIPLRRVGPGQRGSVSPRLAAAAFKLLLIP